MKDLRYRQPTRPFPPSVEEVEAALRVLHPQDPYEAALHLATPTLVIASIAVESSPTVLRWRGSAVLRQEGQSGAARNAVELAHLSHLEGDEYLDLNQSDPVEWCKDRVSGTHRVLFGSSILLGAPVVLARPEVPSGVMREGLRWWLAQSEQARVEGILSVLNWGGASYTLSQVGHRLRVDPLT